MASIHPIASEAYLKQILAMLYGDVGVKGGTAVSADPGSKSMVAVFISDDDVPVTACVFDYKFAAFSGASLTRIPPGGAEDMADSGDFTPMLLGNVQEIMNICSRLFMESHSPHLRLDKVYMASDVPDGARAMLNACVERADYCVDIPNYGAGNLCLLAT